MDEKTLNILEFDKIRQKLAEHTSFLGGQSLALDLHPTTDKADAQRWQAETREAVHLLDSDVRVTIGGTRDVRRPADNAQRGFTLPPEDFLDIRSTLIAARTLKRQLLKLEDKYPTLADIAYLIEECPGLVSAIGQTLDDRGEVLDSASTQLASIRRQLRIAHGRIQDKLQNLLNSSMNQYLQESLITMRGGRYVVPVKADHKGRIRGIVHDHSGSGATLWVEPMGTVSMNNEYRGLQIKEQEEIQRILSELSGRVADQGPSLKRVVERMAELDLILAKGRYAIQLEAVEPDFVDWRTFPELKPPKHANERAKWTPPPRNPHPGSTIWVKGARHPLLDQATVVATDLLLDEDTFLVLITGPNTGGKTVSLKTTGLMTLMAQSGLHVPAIEARLTVFDNVFADIGDEQSIEQSLSTFSGHVTNIIRVLDKVDDRSLVIFDELGSGTDPAEGAALAQAIVNFLRDKGATTFVATHYPELKLYASQTRGATNASLLFDIETLSPTYEMTIGIPGKSNAIAIARRLGLEETILDDSLKLLGAGNNKTDTLLDSIYDIRDKASAQEAQTRLALKEATDLRGALKKRLDEIELEREQVLDEARKEGLTELDQLRTELRKIRRQLREGRRDSNTSSSEGLSLNALKDVNKTITAMEEELTEPRPDSSEERARKKAKRLRKTLQVGDIVLVKTLGSQGEIVSLAKKEAEIAVGRLHMRAKLRDLELVAEKEEVEEEVSVAPAGYTANTSPSPGMELDIRGQRVEQGISQLESYLDSAALSGLPYVRIIHGKGTGRLRSAVRKALSKNTNVSSWEEGKDGEGGNGVTVAKLKL